MSGLSRLVGVNVNCQWPGFSSTRLKAAPWSDRIGVIVAAVKGQAAHVVIAQELGQTEASQVFTRLGSVWSYQRLGLNVVGWRADTLTYKATREKYLPAHGQMARTALAVKLRGKGQARLQLFSTHLAAAASDLSPAAAVVARRDQAQQFVSWANDDEDDWPSILGADLNSRQHDPDPLSPRPTLTKYGWKIDADTVEIGHLDSDAKRGIDVVASNYDALLDDVDVFSLGRGSDHDGRRFVFHTTRK